MSEGNELFRLLSGANNLVFEDLTTRNFGNGVFRAGADISNLTICDVDASNVARFLENYASGTATSATVSGLTVENVNVTGYSRSVIRLQYDTHDVQIDNVVGDSARCLPGNEVHACDSGSTWRSIGCRGPSSSDASSSPRTSASTAHGGSTTSSRCTARDPARRSRG